MNQEIVFTYASKEDIKDILSLINELAIYEHLEDEVIATEELLLEWLFEKPRAEVVIGRVDNKVVGYTLFFYNFSTFLGRAGIYLEDLYVKLEYRGKGYGKALLMNLAKIAVERQCGRLEWSCLDWNQSSIDFYKSLGAKAMEGWSVYRLTGESLENLVTE